MLLPATTRCQYSQSIECNPDVGCPRDDDDDAAEVEEDIRVQDESTGIGRGPSDAMSQASSQVYDADWDDSIILEEPLCSPKNPESTQTENVCLSRLGSGSGTIVVSTSSESLKRTASDQPGTPPQPKRSRSLFTLEALDPPEPRFNIIAHSTRHQKIFNNKGLSWGVQYEIARLWTLNRLKWESIAISDLDELTGPSSEAAPKVAQVLLGTDAAAKDPLVNHYFTKEQLMKSPYPELDREDKILAGIGNLLGFSEGVDGCFGGKVIQSARLIPTISGKGTKQLAKLPIDQRYRIQLERQELGHSTRLTRFYGSRRVIRVTLGKSLYQSNSSCLTDYFRLGHVLNGRVFRVFAAKDRNVYLAETDEVYDGCLLSEPQDKSRKSITELIRWHNSLDFNGNQAMTKWSSRMGLCLSTSVPVVKFAFENIHLEDDKYSSDYDPASGIKPKSEMIMTDGCGLINRAALLHIRDRMSLVEMPCAVQARLGGTKGMYMLHPDPGRSDEPPKLWYRPSQLKVVWSPRPEESQLILDLVRLPHTKFPSRLSAETLVNLAHNGVPHKVFIELLRSGLNEEVRALTTWSGGESGVAALWDAVFSAGHLIGERLQRENAASARARGYILDDEDVADDLMNDDDLGINRPAAWWPDEISGCPCISHEAVCSLLAAGFTPDQNLFLFDKLERVLDIAISKYTLRFRLVVPASVEAFVLPDPSGELEEGQVFFSFSKIRLDPVTDEPIQVITGPVIASRHPCKLPTDVRKFMAVDCLALRKYTDVVIFSTKGKVSPVSYLGGGDYDGDTVTMIWEPAIVNSFSNAPEEMSLPPSNLRDQFDQNIETVEDFQMRVSQLDACRIQDEVSKVLLSALNDTTTVGIYSTYHDKSVFRWGYEDYRTRRLAHMFTTQLDGSKSGLRVKKEVLRADAREWSNFTPFEWKTTPEEKEKQKTDGINRRHLRRDKPGLGKFIMEDLYKFAKAERGRHMDEYRKGRPKFGDLDEHLTAPYRETRKRAEEFRDRFQCSALLDDLNKLEVEVQAICRTYHLSNQKLYGTSKIQDRQDILRKLSLQFAKCFVHDAKGAAYSPDEAVRIKASYAYIYGFDQKSYRFAFEIAFRELCAIKAKALGPSSTLIQDMYNKMAVHRSVLGRKRTALFGN